MPNLAIYATGGRVNTQPVYNSVLQFILRMSGHCDEFISLIQFMSLSKWMVGSPKILETTLLAADHVKT